MDDCLSGSSDLNEFETLKAELSQLLQKGGMHLHKWCSSRTPTREPQTFPLDRNSEEVTVKTLTSSVELDKRTYASDSYARLVWFAMETKGEPTTRCVTAV
ncbi:uncharacterized protein NPIL_473311 [Nephila pilipes]|uniref:Uncharacterized protein n=1 Tax=Nephila pilipes TaxID=299642 RepID=A0A8X6N1F9_NEPPI|nr:uncharacterized protein NPIL_473311 [Nephila pilipes]